MTPIARLDDLGPDLVAFGLVLLFAAVSTACLLASATRGLWRGIDARLAEISARTARPALRRAVHRSMGMGLTASVAVAAGTGPVDATDEPPAGEPAVMVQVRDPSDPAPPRSTTAPTSSATMRRLRPEDPVPATTVAPPTPANRSRPVMPMPPPPPHAGPAPDTADTRTIAPPTTSSPVPGTADTWTIAPGDHLWLVAAETLADRWARPPTDHETLDYLRTLIAANRDRLVDPANADLVHPGQVMFLP